MIKTTSDWGGARSNGRIRYRKNGRFIKTPALDVDVCPNCRHLIFKEVTPVYTHGFVDPRSMVPKKPDTCHHCGINFAEYEADRQLDNMVLALADIAKTGWMS